MFTGLRTLLSKICPLMKQVIHVPIITLEASAEDGDYDGEDDDDNHSDDDDDDDYDYDQDYEC